MAASTAAVNGFLQVANYWLVSRALAHSLAAVTHEKPVDTPNRVTIPNVRVGMGVKVMTLLECRAMSGRVLSRRQGFRLEARAVEGRLFPRRAKPV